MRFPLQTDDATLTRALDASPVLHRELEETEWHWFPEAYDEIDFEERVSILGHISLSKDFLLLETNSTARAERGRTLLTGRLGDLVGSPSTVHDNVALVEDSAEALEVLTETPPEVEEAITAHLTSHYRKTLDEPVPMLTGLSPRQCAADPVCGTRSLAGSSSWRTQETVHRVRVMISAGCGMNSSWSVSEIPLRSVVTTVYFRLMSWFVLGAKRVSFKLLLTMRFRRSLARLQQDLFGLDERIGKLTSELEDIARTDLVANELLQLPGGM